MSNDTQYKPKSHRFNVFLRGQMWERLQRYRKLLEKDSLSRVWLSDIIHEALVKYLPQEKK